MQSDYLERDSYSVSEVQGLFAEYTATIAGRFTMEKAGLIAEMERFLLSKEIATKQPAREKPSSPQGPVADILATTGPSRPSSKVKKAGFFSGFDKNKVDSQANKDSSSGEENPVDSKYPLEPPKAIDGGDETTGKK
jgi:hypothetical protein